jgi:hypothetical protein
MSDYRVIWIVAATVWIVKSPSPVKSIVIELYRNDYSRTICDTADDRTCVTVNCVNVRANVQQIRYIQNDVKLFVALYTQHVTISYHLKIEKELISEVYCFIHENYDAVQSPHKCPHNIVTPSWNKHGTGLTKI